MNPLLLRARLLLLSASVLVLVGGMIFAMARWNDAETDRAFVDSAARAARLPDATPSPPRYWAPVAGARPDTTTTLRIEAAERLRALPPSPAQMPGTLGKPPPAAP